MRQLLSVIIAGTTVGLSIACERPGPVFTTSTSPQGQYVVRLSGRPDRVQMPFLHWVRADVLRGDEFVVRGRRIHTTGRLADGFIERYPIHNWPRENVFRLGRSDEVPPKPQDIVFIRNESARQVRFLRVDANALFLVIDWPAQTSRSVPTTGTVRWVAVEGMWEDGTEIAAVERSFDVAVGERSEYSIVLRDGAALLYRRPL